MPAITPEVIEKINELKSLYEEDKIYEFINEIHRCITRQDIDVLREVITPENVNLDDGSFFEKAINSFNSDIIELFFSTEDADPDTNTVEYGLYCISDKLPEFIENLLDYIISMDRFEDVNWIRALGCALRHDNNSSEVIYEKMQEEGIGFSTPLLNGIIIDEYNLNAGPDNLDIIAEQIKKIAEFFRAQGIETALDLALEYLDSKDYLLDLANEFRSLLEQATTPTPVSAPAVETYDVDIDMMPTAQINPTSEELDITGQLEDFFF